MILKFFKKPIVKSVLNGVVDSVPVLSTIRQNIKASQSTGEGKTEPGKIDWIRLIICIASVAIIVSIVLGKITVPDALNILELLKQF